MGSLQHECGSFAPLERKCLFSIPTHMPVTTQSHIVPCLPLQALTRCLGLRLVSAVVAGRKGVLNLRASCIAPKTVNMRATGDETRGRDRTGQGRTGGREGGRDRTRGREGGREGEKEREGER